MPKQKVPDLAFDFFVIGELKELFNKNKIFINSEYQRGVVWKDKQKIGLVKSIEERYSIGVLVLYVNEKGNYEILDGQQRLMTIHEYLFDKVNLSRTELQKYTELDTREKALIDAYCVYYLKLKSHSAASKEEDIVQTFLRLQEGTPLNKAEKVNAHRGAFKDAFIKAYYEFPLFKQLPKEKRFRYRLLAAELLNLELEGDFEHAVFPGLDLESLLACIKTYKREVPKKKLSFYLGTLDMLYKSLNYIITGLKPREVVSFYLLLSYLRKKKAGNENLINELYEFALLFLQKLYSFSIYDDKPPKGLTKNEFEKYKTYKEEARKQTSADSIINRFNIIVEEYKRIKPFIEKDTQRYHDTEQKRTLFFRQNGICPQCNKPMIFNASFAHHNIEHSQGGLTSDLANSVLLHEKCHQKLH